MYSGMGIGKQRRQAGLTIIELIVVVAIIGIIAAVAMPNYRAYSLRAKVSEVLLAFSDCRNILSDIYLSASTLPAIENWGCEREKPGRYIERITVTAEGIVKLTIGNELTDLRVNLHDITFAPLNVSGQLMTEDDLGNPIRRWRCGAATDGTDVKAEYLPGSCRGV
jgi:type IV pilus assembly protein PilA